MIVGLHEDENGRFDPYLQIYESILVHNGIECKRIEASQSDFWETVGGLSLVVFHWVYIDRDQQLAEVLIPLIEREMQIPCFPDWSTFWHYNNKIKQFYLLQAHGFPVVESFPFWKRSNALNWLEGYDSFPLVNKLSRGALSEDVILIHNKEQARKLVKQMFGRGIRCGQLSDYTLSNVNFYLKKIRRGFGRVKNRLLGQWQEQRWQREKDYVFFQQFLPDNHFTTRVTVIGDRAFSFAIQNAENDFRAYDMRGLDYSPDCLNEDCIEIAFEISTTLGFQSMSYDFLFDENGDPVVCEMGYTAKAHDIFRCKGYFDQRGNWHEGHYWPQFCQLQDLLVDCLRQPEIDFRSLRWG